MFHEHKNMKLNQFSSISKEANFRVLQFYPLKMNIVLGIQKMVIKEIRIFYHRILFPSLSNSILLVGIPLYSAHSNNLSPSNLLKILTDTPNNTQVTRPLFLFSLYYQFSFLKYSPSNGAFLLSWS